MIFTVVDGAVSDKELLQIGDRLWSADIRKFRMSRGDIHLLLQHKTVATNDEQDLAKTR